MNHHTSTLTPELASRKLETEVGYTFSAAEITVEARENRWLARLPGGLLAWFPATEAGAGRLARERMVLQLLSANCTFRVPHILAVARDGSVDVRELVPGSVDPFRVFQMALADVNYSRELGRQIGNILAQQHSDAIAHELDGKLPGIPYWPLPSETVLQQLSESGLERELVQACERALTRYDGVAGKGDYAVLVHGDVGFHNFAMELESGTIHGVFDYDSAILGDPHVDFRYLIFDRDRYELFDEAREAYESVTGRTILRDRVQLYNAACAICYLSQRDGVPPEQKFAGRTLEEDIRWVRHALGNIGVLAMR